MVMIVNGGPDVYASVAFGQKSPATVQFLQQQYDNLSHTLIQAGNSFVDKSRELFERYNGHTAMRLAKAALRSTQHMFQHDVIYSMQSIGAIQQAQLTMQRWIMASPDVRKMYQAQQCDGYSDTYVDMHPGTIGEDHYDYRKVMTGVIQLDPENEEIDWFRKTWYTDHDLGDVDLTLSEKVDILSVWDLMKTMMKPGKEDPTSPYCTIL